MAKVKLLDEQIEVLVRKELRWHLRNSYSPKPWVHPDDITYEAQLKEALKVVLEYFGGDPDEFE